MQGAEVNADCGAGMSALHISALRGEMFLTELLLAHGAHIDQRDMSGNTPLIYACHFYRQHGKGVQLCAQLLFRKADPHYRVKDGKYAGKSALDLMEKACLEPNTDENEASMEAITKMWVSIKSQPANKKLFQVSSKKDNFGYALRSIDWELPDDMKDSGYAPIRLDVESASILEERFTLLEEYLFNDEGDKVKVYITFPDSASASLGKKENLEVCFEYQSFDLKLRTEDASFRLKIEPLYGSIEVDQCRHRASVDSKKVTLTLAKRHKNRRWSSLQKAAKEGPMETVILEKTIIKLGSLLALGFGEAGANIISHNMKGSDSAGVNAILPGLRVDCVIGLCRVQDFSTATEVLQGRIMTFVNQIAEIIHGVVDEFHGVSLARSVFLAGSRSPNKNSGDQFLVIWRMDTETVREARGRGRASRRWHTPQSIDVGWRGPPISEDDEEEKKEKSRRIAEMSILAFCKILGALHRSALLADYRTHPGLQYRLQARNGAEASEVRVNLSFGLHAGWAIEGAVGSEFKIDASYVSPNVNIASSVERCTQVYGVPVVIAQSCMELCSLEFMNKGRLIDRVLLSGSSVPMRLYCVRGPGGGGGSRGPGPGVELHRAGGEPGLEWAWANYSTRLVRHTFPSPKWFNGLNFACSTLEDDRWDEVSDGEAARPQAHVKVDPLKMWSHVVLFPHCSWELSLSLSVV
ncbi:unnamed protein product [Durusdinium trenchii]|uniref:CS domain-containing protein n=1 Tax=Durusdinium trenchii TaxID=1381693 RepID=A0ABP0JC08_9DINO